MTFNPDKPFTTRDGRKAEIAWRDWSENYPLAGRVQNGADYWLHQTWTLDGQVVLGALENPSDLANTPEPPIATYINVYAAIINVYAALVDHRTIAAARENASPGRLGLIRLLRDPDTHAPLSVCLVDPQTGEPI